MLKWRAITAALRATFPDRTGGLYTHEELDPENVTVDDDGSMFVDSSHYESPAQTTQSNGASKKSAEAGGDDPQTPLWQDDINQVRQLITDAIEAGYIEKPAKIGDGKAALLQLIGKQDLNDFTTPLDAKAAIESVGKALQEQLANRDADKSQAAEKPEVTAPAAATDTPSPSNDAIVTLSNKDKAELADWIKENFAGRDMATVSQDLDTDWSEFSTIGHAKNMLIKKATDECWAIITDMMTHTKQGNSSYLTFHSPIDDIRLYSRQKLTDLLGENFPDNAKIKELPIGESLMLSQKISVSYEAKGHYNNVTNTISLDKVISF